MDVWAEPRRRWAAKIIVKNKRTEKTFTCNPPKMIVESASNRRQLGFMNFGKHESSKVLTPMRVRAFKFAKFAR